MNFPPDHYFQVAIERMRQAKYLFQDGGSYALAIYTGGVAVECLLRAFKGRQDPTFDERHNLLRLLSTSGLIRVNGEVLRRKQWSEERIEGHGRELRVAVNDVYNLWANSYRFASEQRLRAHLKKITGYERIKGDYLKETARRILGSAQSLIDKGTLLWHE